MHYLCLAGLQWRYPCSRALQCPSTLQLTLKRQPEVMFHGYSSESGILSKDGYGPLDPILPNNVQGPLLSLSPLARQFFIPSLTDKPQNPIMDTLKRAQEPKSTSLLFQSHHELESPVVKLPLNSQPQISVHDFWKDASTRNLGLVVCLHFNCISFLSDGYIEQSSVLGRPATFTS